MWDMTYGEPPCHDKPQMSYSLSTSIQEMAWWHQIKMREVLILRNILFYYYFIFFFFSFLASLPPSPADTDSGVSISDQESGEEGRTKATGKYMM